VASLQPKSRLPVTWGLELSLRAGVGDLPVEEVKEHEAHIVLTWAKKPGFKDSTQRLSELPFRLRQVLASGHWCLSLWQWGIIFIKHFVFV
jgi:hypothetical protein